MSLIQNDSTVIECIVRHDILSVPLPRPVALAVATNLRKHPEYADDVSVREVRVVPSTTSGKSIVCIRRTASVAVDMRIDSIPVGPIESYHFETSDAADVLGDFALEVMVERKRLSNEIQAVMERQAAA